MSLTAVQARKIILSFEGVKEKGALGGGEAFEIGGKFFVQIGTREPDTLMLKYPTLDERDMMLEAHPDLLYITEHFRNYKACLRGFPSSMQRHCARCWNKDGER